MALPSLHRWQPHLVLCGSLILVIASLFWAKAVLIPVVLAILLTFILSPLVAITEKAGLNRVASSIVAVLLAVFLFVGIGSTMVWQIKNLATDLPHYQEEITTKIIGLRDAGKGTWMEDLGEMIQNISQLLQSAEAKQPLPVKVESSSLPILQSAAVSALDLLINAGLVTVLVGFMLIQREDLRNRLIRLWGNGNLTIMTQALDDAGRRISRFLLMQLFVNVVFGLALGLGLFLIGVPYAFVWGLLGALFRYIPYLGPWVAAVFPVTISFAVLPGWLPTLSVIALIIVLELIISNVIEPKLYGHSIGVSAVALLVAAAFWAWLWGPVGLILSIPLTACLAVLGKYVPHLEVFHILLGVEPVLEPHVLYYQRLLAGDQDEAADFVEDYQSTHSVELAYDKVLLPALVLAQRNLLRGELAEDVNQFIIQTTREILDESVDEDTDVDEAARPDEGVLVFGCPARDDADGLPLLMLRNLLDDRKFHFEILSSKSLTAEVVERIKEDTPSLVCVGMLPGRRLAHTRYFCKRLRAHFPDLKIMVGCWGLTVNREKATDKLRQAGADQIATTLAESRDQIMTLFPVLHYGNGSKRQAAASA